jgi:hypothetical protein
VTSILKPRHMSPLVPPAVGGNLSSHMTSTDCSLTPIVGGDATTYAHVGIVHGGVCAFTCGIKIATVEKVSSKIKAVLSILVFFIFLSLNISPVETNYRANRI